MQVLVLCALLVALPYSAELTQWRADYEAGLKKPGGWLSVTGLSWLQEGANPSPAGSGTFRLTKGSVVWEPASGAKQVLKPDDPGPPDVVNVGDVSMVVINRGGRMGVRVRDPHAPTRRDFTGTKWYPPDEKWRVKARWTAYPKPKQIMITNILGMKEPEPSPGFAEFTLNGRVLRLEPVVEDNQLFFMFRDMTNGRETYPAGRFLYADMPHGDQVEIDFNRAHNPPCAFTAYATCPLPPRQNTLNVAVEAGEKRYGKH